MLTVDSNNNITITKGDSLPLTVSLTKNNVPYDPVEGDVLRFACSKGYVGEAGYKLILTENIPTDTLTILISASRMDALFNGLYRYDVELTHADGQVETVISADLVVTGEAE